MKQLFTFIHHLFSQRISVSTITKNFTTNINNDSDLRVKAIHEVCHAVAMSMYMNGEYRDIERKKIKLHKNSPSKDPCFQYMKKEETSNSDLFIDMMVCLAGFVGELEFLNSNNTNAKDDIEDWYIALDLWLKHYSKDYVAYTKSEVEVSWNNKIINHHKQRQTMMLRKIFATNKDVIMSYIDSTVKNNGMNNDEINEMLDLIIIPISVQKEFEDIINDAKLTWY